MDVRVIRDIDSLTALEPEWLDLWRRSPNATPFQSPMWLLPWWKHFGSNELHTIALREGGRLKGLAPLYILRDDSESLGLFIGSGISDGDRHNHDNLPILMAGRGNGVITPGRHLRFPENTPLSNLYVSMLQGMGVNTPRFGDSTGPLQGLAG